MINKLHPSPIRCSGLQMKMPLHLQAASGTSLGERFAAPYQFLELSSEVEVESHQFFSKFQHVLDSSASQTDKERERGRGPVGLGL